MNLYEINVEIEKAINDLFATADAETGEVNQEAMDRLTDLQMQRDEKLDNIGAYIKNLLAEAKMLKDEEAALKARREAKEKKAENLKKYLASVLDGKPFESVRVKCSWRSSDAVSIPDESLIPKKFMVKKIEFKPDKNLIKEILKAGKKVKGATLETRNNLQIK